MNLDAAFIFSSNLNFFTKLANSQEQLQSSLTQKFKKNEEKTHSIKFRRKIELNQTEMLDLRKNLAKTLNPRKRNLVLSKDYGEIQVFEWVRIHDSVTFTAENFETSRAGARKNCFFHVLNNKDEKNTENSSPSGEGSRNTTKPAGELYDFFVLHRVILVHFKNEEQLWRQNSC